MLDLGRHSLLGIDVDAVDYAGAVSRIVEAAGARRPLGVSALAVHGLMTGALDPVHRYRLNNLGLLVPDGQPVRWALNLLHGVGLPDRVYGPNLMLKVCDKAAELGFPVYLYGSRPEVIERLVARLSERVPELCIAGAEPSKFRQVTHEEKQAIARRIRESGAQMTFVGLGCPRQEIWAYEYLEELSMPILAVGAAFEFHAGTQPQAPPLLQRYGLEWAFRLVHEPRRLWRRYLYLNPLYVGLIALQALGLRQMTSRASVAPEGELLYG